MNADERTALHAWVGRWSRQRVTPGQASAIVAPLLTFNQMARRPWRDGDVDVLVTENQGVWLWGRDQQGLFVERQNEPGHAWLPTGEDEAAFWLHHAAFEFLSSRFPARRSRNDAPRAQAEAIFDATEPLPCGEWHWPGRLHSMRYRGASLAMVCEDGNLFWLVLGGPDEESLAWADVLQIRWDESDSRRDA